MNTKLQSRNIFIVQNVSVGCQQDIRLVKLKDTHVFTQQNSQKKYALKRLSIASRPISIKLNDNQASQIAENIVKYLLISGRPLSDADSFYLKRITTALPCGRSLSEDTIGYAAMIKAQIRDALISSSSVSLAIDEWQDAQQIRYLGITCQALIDSKYVHYTLGLIPIISCRANSETHANLII